MLEIGVCDPQARQPAVLSLQTSEAENVLIGVPALEPAMCSIVDCICNMNHMSHICAQLMMVVNDTTQVC